MSVEAFECTVQSLESSSTYSKLDQAATNKSEAETLRGETDVTALSVSRVVCGCFMLKLGSSLTTWAVCLTLLY